MYNVLLSHDIHHNILQFISPHTMYCSSPACNCTDHWPPTQMVGLIVINNHAVVVRLSGGCVGRGREERN